MIPWFSVRDTPSGSDCFVFGTEKTITGNGLANSSAKMIVGGTTIISARGTVGNLAIAGENMTFNQSCYALRPIDDKCICFVFLSAQHVVGQLKKKAHGSVFSTITRATFDSVLFPTIPSDVRDAFEGIVSSLFERIRASVKENQTLAKTRDYLLPKLMSGEIRVGGVAAQSAEQASNVIELPTDLLGNTYLPADKERERDAVIVAAMVLALQKYGGVVGNLRYQKGCYFVYRFMNLSTSKFERWPGGPYSPEIAQAGYKEALANKYIRYKNDNHFPGNLPANSISEIDTLIKKYKLGDAVSLVKTNLKGKDKVGLELWATVDYAMVALRSKNIKPTINTVTDYIRNDPKWADKLTDREKKKYFTPSKIGAAIAELDELFGVSA